MIKKSITGLKLKIYFVKYNFDVEIMKLKFEIEF